MVFEVIWHPSASIDLSDEVEFVYKEFGWAASRKLYFDVMEAVSRLSIFPEIGVLYEGFIYRDREVRVLNIRQNALVYSIEEKQITIIVFWNYRQNPTRLKTVIASRL